MTIIMWSITPSSNAGSGRQSAHAFGFLSSGFQKTRAVQAGVLVLLSSLMFSQPVLSKPGNRPPQTPTPCDGFKLFQAGLQLAETGTRTALKEAIEKYKAAYA